MNLVIMIGRLTKDVELRYNGDKNFACARFSIAVQRNYKNREGKYDADFINCVCFGPQAETIEKYFRKGERIGVQGEWTTGKYKGKDGNLVYTNDLNVKGFDFIESKGDRQQSLKTEIPKINDDDGFMHIPENIDNEIPFD